MQKRILIIGCGFAGMWSALSAARLLDREGVDTSAAEVALISPEPRLTIRPRLYEAGPGTMVAPLQELFNATGVRYIEGQVETIDTDAGKIGFVGDSGRQSTLAYDQLVLAAGSHLFRPDIPGLRDHAFSIDQRGEAAAFEAHCHGLARMPDTAARNTAVVGGGGFTGIEIAAELPARLRSILGADAAVRVILVEKANEIGPDLGPGPRPVIIQALSELGVECRLEAAVIAIDANAVTLSNGDRILTNSVVWTAGLRASALTAQIPGERDPIGRLHVDRNLQVPSVMNVFATGDTAYAATDDQGHHALMSCQHAINLGRSAGNNAAAALLGIPMIPYSQPRYVTGLDLGPWGAVHTTGWDRKVTLTGAESKARKEYINQVYIYPPKADRAEAFAAADPAKNLAV